MEGDMNNKYLNRFAKLILCAAACLMCVSAFAQENTDQKSAPEAAQNNKVSDKGSNAVPGIQPAKTKGTVDANARQYVDAVQAYYDQAKTYSATFEQDYETVDGVKKKSTGTVWFKKPGMMRWDYETPASRFLISDGKNLWSWEPVYRQYCRQTLAGSQLPSALSFLSGVGRIDDEFSVSLKKVKGNQVTLTLKPVVASMAYDNIEFEILMPTAKVYRAKVFDAMGNVNLITFKSPEINSELDNASFQFEPPKDAKHICE